MVKKTIRRKPANHNDFYLPIALAVYPSVRRVNDHGCN